MDLDLDLDLDLGCELGGGFQFGLGFGMVVACMGYRSLRGVSTIAWVLGHGVDFVAADHSYYGCLGTYTIFG